MNIQWKPSEIIIHRKVENDPVTRSIIEKCNGIPIKFINSAKPDSMISASEILSSSGDGMLDKILAGKQVVFVSPVTGGDVDLTDLTTFKMDSNFKVFSFFDDMNLKFCFFNEIY